MLLTKNDFRQTCLKKIKTATGHNKIYKDSLINKNLQSIILEQKNKKSVLFYYPMGFEVNIKKTLLLMRRYGIKVYLPFMEKESFKMVEFRLPLQKKKFGIFEAGSSIKKIKEVDIAIVPTLGVDVNLQRIGFGKGMYDRFYEKLKIKPYTIFIQPELCYTSEEVCDDYDVSCDILLTPKKILYKR